jgi:hypothetical protein
MPNFEPHFPQNNAPGGFEWMHLVQDDDNGDAHLLQKLEPPKKEH